MELGTFGAIFRFALEIEAQTAAFYEALAEGKLAEIGDSLARESRKRVRRLERARREGVQEMILESIQGLDSDDYQVETSADLDPWEQAIALEERAARFYSDAAEKMPMRGVARIFQRMARESADRQARLQERPVR